MFLPATSTLAEEKATPNEVYELILSAVPVLQQLGEQDLVAFNDPKGEFVYKDTYVLVHDCEKMVMAAHPNPKFVGFDLNKIVDKTRTPPNARTNPLKWARSASDPTAAGWNTTGRCWAAPSPPAKSALRFRSPGPTPS